MIPALVSSFTSHDVLITDDAPASKKQRAMLITPSPWYNVPEPELQALSTTIGDLIFRRLIS
jgi:hypothetical protein